MRQQCAGTYPTLDFSVCHYIELMDVHLLL